MLWSVPGTMITNCKAMLDSVARSESSKLGVPDYLSAIETMRLRKAIRGGNARLRWMHGHAQFRVGLTKPHPAAFQLIRGFVRGQKWRLVFVVGDASSSSRNTAVRRTA